MSRTPLAQTPLLAAGLLLCLLVGAPAGAQGANPGNLHAAEAAANPCGANPCGY